MSATATVAAIPAGFKNLGHYIASGAKKFVAFVKTDLDPALAKIQAEAPVIEAVTRVVCPQAAEIEDSAFYALGIMGQALDGITDATAANGINIKLDTDALAKIKSAVAAVKTLPAAPVVPVVAPATK
jgi:hypothetical protein